MVSICIITYQQEAYVSKMLTSLYEQKFDFPVELIISDDCSQDDTQQKINETLKSAPKNFIIRKYFQSENIGILQNFWFVLRTATMKYIAICEGDDFWTDPLKLKKQTDFLESNNTHVGVSSNSLMIFTDGSKDRLFKDKSTQDKTLHTTDFLEARPFHTASFLFRQKTIANLKFPQVLSADRFLFLYVSSKGPIRYINDVTCVYRKDSGGISSSVSSKKMKKDIAFFKASSEFLTNNELIRLKKFILRTIFSYSRNISLMDYFYYGLWYIKCSSFTKGSFRFIKNHFNKVLH